MAGADAVSREVLDDAAGQYAVSLASLVFPVAGHVAFNAIAAASMLLLGHPWMAATAFVTGTAADIAQQVVVRRWRRDAATVAEAAGLLRVAALCATRMAVFVGPLVALMLPGGVAEAMLCAVMMFSLLAIGQTVGGVSKLLWWAYIGPVLAAVAIVAVVRLHPAAAAGVLLALLSCSAIMAMLANNTSQVIVSWRAEYNAKKEAVAELEAARDEARRANRAKSNFLATMSHEIRTPMNGVLGMAQLLKRDELDPEQAARLEVLIDSGEHLLTILNDILDVSKVDAGKLEMAPSAELLDPFLQRVVTFWRARADERGVALRLVAEGDLPEAVMIDGLRLRQVLFNLIGNALKFTERGAVEVHVTATPLEEGRVQLRLSVRDTGPGIAAEHIGALFDRFSQVDDGEVRRFGGAGLGLSIVKQLVELMGGRVWVESTLGEGSRFSVEVPLDTAASEDAAAGEPDLPGSEDAPMDALRILAIDDNAINLLVLDQLLSSLGQTVLKASGGPEALAMLAVEAFDLVLCDIQMPEMSGTEVLQRLRAAPGPNQGVPVLALTADVTSGGRQRYLELGFSEHSAKPIQLPDLLGAMSRAMAAPPPAATRAA